MGADSGDTFLILEERMLIEGILIMVALALLALANRSKLKSVFRRKKRARRTKKPLGPVYEHTRAELMARRHLAEKKGGRKCS